MFEKILVAIDGSDTSDKAVALAGELAGAMGSEVLVLHVREVEVGHLSGAMEPPEDAVALVNATVTDLTGKGVNAKGEARGAPTGHTASLIVEEAKGTGTDVIVMGSRGLSDWHAMLVGSVAHKVINLAHCPVLIAR